MNVVTSLESCAACFDRLEVARSARLAAAPVPLAAALTPAMCAVTSCVAWLTLRVIPAVAPRSPMFRKSMPDAASVPILKSYSAQRANYRVYSRANRISWRRSATGLRDPAASFVSRAEMPGKASGRNADDWFDWRNELGKYCSVLPPVE